MTNKKPTEAEIFKQACYSDDLQKFYSDCINKGILNIQSFLDLGRLEHLTFSPSKTCRGCDTEVKEEDFDYIAGYWTPHSWFPVHKSCKQKAKEYEAFECQKIDADCNDCKHFERGAKTSAGSFDGICKKFDMPTKGFVNQSTGLSCFEHRKSL